MGLGTKQFSGDQGVDLGQTLFETGAVDVVAGESKPSSPPPTTRRQQQQQNQQSEALKCPRCVSTNTKFCYYNNYNKSQPRHFCKDCKRHWTLGGTLRNVPVGGGRKNKRLKLSDPNDDDRSITTTTTTTTTTEQNGKGLYSPNIENLDGSDLKQNQNQESIDFPFSSIDNLVVPSSNYYNESLDTYEQYDVGINVVLENLEESISSSITSSAINNIPFPWPGPDWNWDDIDHVFTPSSDDHHHHNHINTPWNDESNNNDHKDNVAKIKP